MPDEADPPRKYYDLKPKEFERVNDVPSAPAPSDFRPDPGIVRNDRNRIDVRDIARQAAFGHPSHYQRQTPQQGNDVHRILRENHAQAKASGLNELTPQPRRTSRRTRDYWIVMIPVNAFFAFLAFGPYANAMTFTYGIGGMAVFTFGLTWVMFFIMDRY